jgi:hypothetical protein
MNFRVLWTMTARLLIICHRRFGGDCCTCPSSTILKMEAANSSESSIINNQSTPRRTPVACNQHYYSYIHPFSYSFINTLHDLCNSSLRISKGRCLVVHNGETAWSEASVSFGLLFESINIKMCRPITVHGRSQWPCLIRRRSPITRLLGLRVRIPLQVVMVVCSVCCVLCR